LKEEKIVSKIDCKPISVSTPQQMPSRKIPDIVCNIDPCIHRRQTSKEAWQITTSPGSLRENLKFRSGISAF